MLNHHVDLDRAYILQPLRTNPAAHYGRQDTTFRFRMTCTHIARRTWKAYIELDAGSFLLVEGLSQAAKRIDLEAPAAYSSTWPLYSANAEIFRS